MKKRIDIISLVAETNYKKIEETLGIKIRNGQTVQGIRAALNWILK